MNTSHRPSRERVGHFMHDELQYGIDPAQITEVYPVVHNRLVFRSKDIVYKIRPEKSEKSRKDATTEADKLQRLLHFYEDLGYKFREPSSIYEINDFMVIEMPYMGENVAHLIADLDMREYGEDLGPDAFAGFTPEKAKALVTQFRTDLELLEEGYGLIHGDLYAEERGPNNIVYNKALDRLLLIDAEALIDVNSDLNRRAITGARMQQLQVENWITHNMIV